MKLNSNQKKTVAIGLMIFVLSAVYVPCKFTMNGNSVFDGYNFLWNISSEIDVSVIAVEWIAILTTIFGIAFILKDDN